MIADATTTEIPLGEIVEGDCLDVLAGMPEHCIDAVVTDPPYGLRFMGKKWDYDVPSVEIWQQVLRVLKPGGHVLSFGGCRTYHRMVVNIEDAGFEVRDTVSWNFGSGFPKSLDIGKAIDKAVGAEREVVGRYASPENTTGPQSRSHSVSYFTGSVDERAPGDGLSAITIPATPAAEQWDGWGSALKPAMELICLARAPLSEPTIAANVLKWGTGGINVDGCRIEGTAWKAHMSDSLAAKKFFTDGERKPIYVEPHPKGRWPANTLFDVEAARCLDEMSIAAGVHNAGHARQGSASPRPSVDNMFGRKHDTGEMHRFGDSGGASRFFYIAKASRAERTMQGRVENKHATVKPIKLMRYLCRLITPPGGIVLDPFAGSGSTCIAAEREGFQFIGIERDGESVTTARERLQYA